MKKLALLMLALSLSGFAIGCNDAKKPAAPAAPPAAMEEGKEKPAEPAAPADEKEKK